MVASNNLKEKKLGKSSGTISQDRPFSLYRLARNKGETEVGKKWTFSSVAESR